MVSRKQGDKGIPVIQRVQGFYILPHNLFLCKQLRVYKALCRERARERERERERERKREREKERERERIINYMYV